MLTDVDGAKFHLFKHLKDLTLKNGVGLTNLTYEKGLGSSTMERLSLGSCALTDVGLSSVAARHDRLKTIRISDCKKVTDDGIKTLFQHEPFLERLDLIACMSVTSACLEAFEDYCPRLQEVRLYSCSITYAGVVSFAERRPFVNTQYETFE